MSVDEAIEEVVEEVLEDQAEEVAEEVVEEVESNEATEAPVVLVVENEGSPTEELSESLEVAEQIRGIVRDEIAQAIGGVQASVDAGIAEIRSALHEMQTPPPAPEPAPVEIPKAEDDESPAIRHWFYKDRRRK